jgi:ribosomal protein L37AE/L43A
MTDSKSTATEHDEGWECRFCDATFSQLAYRRQHEKKAHRTEREPHVLDGGRDDL